MSTRLVAQEIRELAALADVATDEIYHFVVGISDPGDIEFTVPGDHCAVVVAIEDFNADQVLPRTTSTSLSGSVVTEVVVADWNTGSDLFYVYGPGKVSITLTATPLGGLTYHARAVGYILPQRAYARLSRMSTKNLS